MELEDLKHIWQNNPGAFPKKNEAEIAAMLKGKSKSIITRLKQSVWLELSVTLLVGVGLMIYALTLPSGAMKWTAISIPVIFIGYTIYYIKKLLLLNQFGSVTENIRVNLELLVEKLTSYLKFYKRSYTILYPIYFSLGVLFSGIEQGVDKFFALLSEPRIIAFLTAFAIIFYLASTWLVNWLFRKLYGNHIDRLSSLLRELEPEEN